MSSNERIIPLEDNHDLHSGVIALATTACLKFLGGWQTSNAFWGGFMTGMVAKAAMKTYPHDGLFDMLKTKEDPLDKGELA